MIRTNVIKLDLDKYIIYSNNDIKLQMILVPILPHDISNIVARNNSANYITPKLLV